MGPLYLAMMALFFPPSPVLSSPVLMTLLATPVALAAPAPPLPTIPELIDAAALAAGVSTSTARALAWCESQYRQFGSDGKTLPGAVNPDDRGVYQVNRYYHGADAKRQGIDIETTQGNISFGVGLLKSSGTGPWSASAGCWRPLIAQPSLIPTSSPIAH